MRVLARDVEDVSRVLRLLRARIPLFLGGQVRGLVSDRAQLSQVKDVLSLLLSQTWLALQTLPLLLATALTAIPPAPRPLHKQHCYQKADRLWSTTTLCCP